MLPLFVLRIGSLESVLVRVWPHQSEKSDDRIENDF